MHPIYKFLHLAGVVLWVGGMFFAWMCLRPVAAKQLDAPTRLALWAGVFARFFPWVWAAVVGVVATGVLTLATVGFAHAPPHWHVMLLLGLIMSGIYIYVFNVPYARLKLAVTAQQWADGGKALEQIRKLVGTNLLLGVATIAVATLGRMLH